jgi:hypothetical protein
MRFASNFSAYFSDRRRAISCSCMRYRMSDDGTLEGTCVDIGIGLLLGATWALLEGTCIGTGIGLLLGAARALLRLRRMAHCLLSSCFRVCHNRQNLSYRFYSPPSPCFLLRIWRSLKWHASLSVFRYFPRNKSNPVKFASPTGTNTGSCYSSKLMCKLSYTYPSSSCCLWLILAANACVHTWYSWKV